MILIARSLTTAHIIYRRPDQLWLLQEYVWQEMDAVPGFPALRRFLRFWKDKLEGPIYSIEVASAERGAFDFRFPDCHLSLH